ncbi:MAG: carboxypeptidase-like regulatory domain-containing protein [Pyrinomonadaceae bacterium]
MFFLLLAGLLLVASVFAPHARAQAVYGSISGTVTDATGAVVPGANVVIRSTERNTSDTVVANDSGLYVKERLLPGTYEVRIGKEGFKASIVSPVAGRR